jgi:hypothetical protein
LKPLRAASSFLRLEPGQNSGGLLKSLTVQASAGFESESIVRLVEMPGFKQIFRN